MRTSSPKLSTAADQAATALRALSKLRSKKPVRTISVSSPGGRADVSVTVPREALELFLEVLEHMAHGNAVSVVPLQAELTTQQAADMLNVSRPHLIDLLETRHIAYRRVGTHRRIRVSDLLAFHEKDNAERNSVLDELTEEAQKLGLGY
jgi:excisionase family DNA binding protein